VPAHQGMSQYRVWRVDDRRRRTVMTAVDVNEIGSGSRVAAIACSVLEALSGCAAPMPDSLSARGFERRRAVLDGPGRFAGRSRSMPREQLSKSDLARRPGHPLIESRRRSAVCFAADVGAVPLQPRHSCESAPLVLRLWARPDATCLPVLIFDECEGCSASRPPPRQAAIRICSMSANRVGADRSARYGASSMQASRALPKGAGHSAQERAILLHVSNSGWQAMCGGRALSSSAHWVAELLQAIRASPAGFIRGPDGGALAERAWKASNASIASSKLPKDSGRPWRLSMSSRCSAHDPRELGGAAARHGVAHRERRATSTASSCTARANLALSGHAAKMSGGPRREPAATLARAALPRWLARLVAPGHLRIASRSSRLFRAPVGRPRSLAHSTLLPLERFCRGAWIARRRCRIADPTPEQSRRPRCRTVGAARPALLERPRSRLGSVHEGGGDSGVDGGG
jgi:hypothetical protein